MGGVFKICLLLVALPLINALPRHGARDAASEKKNIVGIASNIVASSILKGQVESETNFVFSPLGYTSILAILTEGAKGQTFEEVKKALEFPEDFNEVRNCFKEVLKNLDSVDIQTSPQFKTWFYVYENNSALPGFRDIIQKYYYVNAKDIERSTYDFDLPRIAEPVKKQNSKDIIELENLMNTKPIDKTGEISGFDNLKIADIEETHDSTKYEEVEKDGSSKFDRVVDDKQYVEVPVIKKEIESQEKNEEKVSVMEEPKDDVKLIKEEPKDEVKLIKEEPKDEVKLIKEEPKEEPAKEVIAKIAETPAQTEEKLDAPEKIDLSLKKFDDEEIMHAVETHPLRKRFTTLGRSLFATGDVASALSGNSLVSRKSGAKSAEAADESDLESKMLLFNGLYYKGSWETPFQQLRSDKSDVFYTTANEKQQVTMMRSRGNYKTGKIFALNSDAIELPYSNKRYSLLAIIPEEVGGLKDVIRKLDLNSISKIASELETHPVQLTIPKFTVETTSRAEKALSKLGLITLFTSKADLSGITEEQNLHVGELVQHVAVRVDEGSSSENFLTASNPLRSLVDVDSAPDRKITANRPFLFFVRDIIDDYILVAGKISTMEVIPQDEF